MIEGPGRTTAITAADTQARVAPKAAAKVARAAAVPPPRDLALSPLAKAAKTIATSPPVDVAKVEALRSAIGAGSYKLEPNLIAERMIALDLPRA